MSFMNSETSALRLSETCKLGSIVIFVFGSFPGTDTSRETFLEQEPECLDSIAINSTDAFLPLLSRLLMESLSLLFDLSLILSCESKLFLVSLELFLDTYLKV
jgi:hypothetical protein